MLVKTTKDLAASVYRFINAPEYQRKIVGGHPRYFVHIVNRKKHFFGLSKFCAFKDLSPIDYITKYRQKKGGGATQKHIRRIVGKEWTPYSQLNPVIMKAFKNSFSKLFPNKHDLRDICCITLGEINAIPREPKNISPEDLSRKLKRQAEIGRIGEKIAVKYEIARLKSAGVKFPEKHVEHVAAKNSAAGFDVFSDSPTTGSRYIEVKTSTNGAGIIYLSAHEVKTLRKHKDEAFVYMVVLDGKGRNNVKEVRNPISIIESGSGLFPLIYKAVIIN